MKLQDQVITLEQAKLLKSLGVTQDAIWFWQYPLKEKMISTSKGIIHCSIVDETIRDNEGDEFDHGVAVAFTVAELFQMLPDYYPSCRFKVNEKSGERKWIATVICKPKPPGIDDIHTAHEFDRFGKASFEVVINGVIYGQLHYGNDNDANEPGLISLAKNDGLELKDFVNWFEIHPKKEGFRFSGQIICWSPDVNY